MIKHLIATGYSNFLAQFSVSLNNIMCAYISIIIIVIAITIIIIITTVFITFLIVIVILLLLLLLLLLLSLIITYLIDCYQKSSIIVVNCTQDQNNYRTRDELKLLTFYPSS